MLQRAALRPRKRNAGRPAEKSAPAFLQWLRGRPCVIDNQDCEGKMEAAHVDYAGDKGMATKVSDRFAVPCCSYHHAQQHRVGIRTFETMHRKNLLALANEYWMAWPGRIAWLRKLAGE